MNPNWIPREQVQTWLHKRTGVLVTERRIGRWIVRGELHTVKVPRRREGAGLYVTKDSLEALVRKYRAC